MDEISKPFQVKILASDFIKILVETKNKERCWKNNGRVTRFSEKLAENEGGEGGMNHERSRREQRTKNERGLK